MNRTKYKYLLSCIILSCIVLSLTGCSFSSKTSSVTSDNKAQNGQREIQPLRIAGSGSNIPLMQILLDEYGKKSGVHINIPVSIGTAGAVKALQENQLDIGLISRELKDSEKQTGLKQISYAKIAIVFGVHRQVPDNNINSDDLVAIYEGKKNTWSNGKNIIVQVREKGDSSNAVLEKDVPGFKKVLDEALNSRRWEIYYTDQEASDAIKTTPNAIGLTDSVAIKIENQIKPLKLNGVEPILDNIRNDSYPYNKVLFFAYKEPLSEQAKNFLEYVYSAEGQKIIANYDSLPLKGEFD